MRACVCTGRPTPPTSTTSVVERRRGRPARAARDREPRPVRGSPHTRRRADVARPAGVGGGPVEPAPLSRASAWQIARRARRRRRRAAGALVQPEDAGDHRLHLRLVGAAVAGDRGLDLGGRVERDRDAALRRGRAGRRRWPARCPSPMATLCCGEDPLDRHDVGGARGRSTRRMPAALEAPAAALDRHRSRVRSARRRATSVAVGRPPSTTPRPHRVRPGSTPSTPHDGPLPSVGHLVGMPRCAAGRRRRRINTRARPGGVARLQLPRRGCDVGVVPPWRGSFPAIGGFPDVAVTSGLFATDREHLVAGGIESRVRPRPGSARRRSRAAAAAGRAGVAPRVASATRHVSAHAAR